jgi:hypothetical protein
MKSLRVIIGSVAIALCFSGCSRPLVELDLLSGEAALAPPAVLEWMWVDSLSLFSQINLVKVDERPVDLRKTNDGGFWIRNLLKLSPGKHRVYFRGGGGQLALHPDAVEFEAASGKQYRAECEMASFKETDGAASTLYFNFMTPVIFEVRNGTPVKIATGSPVPIKHSIDDGKNLLLYEDSRLPKERTASVYVPRRGLLKDPEFFIASVSSAAGDTRIEYRGANGNQAELRLLPGEYRFAVSLRGPLEMVQMDAAMAAIGIKTITLRAEAGRTYRINGNIETVDTKYSNDAIGRPQMTNTMRWNPAFEDVTGKSGIDK